MATKIEERPHKKARLFGSLEHMVTLVVGKKEDATFTIHQNMLCEASPFFKAACKPEWMKPDDRVIKLPEDDKVTVQAMIYWIYHDEIYVSRRIFISVDDHGDEKGATNTPQGLFAKLYVLGDKYRMPRLQNDAVDALLGWDHELLDLRVVPYIYYNTLSEDSPLRRVVVRRASWQMEDGDPRFANCKTFLIEVLDTLLRKRGIYAGRVRKEVNITIKNPRNDFCWECHIHDENNGSLCKELKRPCIVDEEDTEILTS